MIRHALACALLMTSLMAAETSPGLLGVPVKDIDGKATTLGAVKGGKAWLVVNVASECGYTRQYTGLQALYDNFKAKGLVVAGFPCNDFGGQEPGSEKDIKKFCKTNFKVAFPMYAKVKIKGDAPHPLFEKLMSKDEGHPGPVGWNFNKFLISADGKLIARFGSDVEPDSEELEKAIEKALK
ncbi:MAG: glutathione peroxidase [Verrucomicrobiota bacterium]